MICGVCTEIMLLFIDGKITIAAMSRRLEKRKNEVKHDHDKNES